jgi:predicted transcriptional regulator
LKRSFLIVKPDEAIDVFKALASPARIEILKLLRAKGSMNVNDIAEFLGTPQSSTSTHVGTLEKAGLIQTKSVRARKGVQKICTSIYEEIVATFETEPSTADDTIEVAMPVGLYTQFEVSAPCGMCSPEGIIGYLDSPDTFLNPDRMKASLLWFTKGFVEYQFPNNAKLLNVEATEIEVILELSSEVPGTSDDWPSDIGISLNGIDLGSWTSPGDFGDRRGKFTPDWWKLRGSQYGKLKSFRVTENGTFVDGTRLSDVKLADLQLRDHQSIRLRIEISDTASHPGGVNIFGQGFGNYDQDIVLRIKT